MTSKPVDITWKHAIFSIFEAFLRLAAKEKSRRYQVEGPEALKDFAKLVHDRMTECEYPKGISTFEEHQEPEKWSFVPVMAQGAKALEDGTS